RRHGLIAPFAFLLAFYGGLYGGVARCFKAGRSCRAWSKAVFLRSARRFTVLRVRHRANGPCPWFPLPQPRYSAITIIWINTLHSGCRRTTGCRPLVAQHGVEGGRIHLNGYYIESTHVRYRVSPHRIYRGLFLLIQQCGNRSVVTLPCLAQAYLSASG